MLNNEGGKALFIAKVLQSLMIFSVIIYGLILYAFLPESGFGIFPANDPLLVIITLVLACVTLISLAIGFLWPRVLAMFYRQTMIGFVPQYVICMSLFCSIGIYGLILGIIGAYWYISLPFLVVSLAALVLSFPTKAKWDKFTEKISRAE